MHVTQIIDTLNWGGVQSLQVTLAHAAEKQQLEITVVALRDSVATPYKSELAALGVPVEIFPAKKVISPNRIWQLSQFFREQGTDLVHTHLSSANFAGVCAAKLAGLPVVASLHLSMLEPHQPRRILETLALRFGANRIIAVGEATREVHQHRFPRQQIDILPNAVSAPAPLSKHMRDEIRRGLTRNSDLPILLSVGRLATEKGFDDLLAVMSKLRDLESRFWLGIVGEGPQRSSLEQLIATNELNDHITLLGARSDVSKLLQAADLYVCAPRSEALPISILEAMAAGLPVVATDVGEIHTVVDSNCGHLVAAGSIDALTYAIASLLRSAEKRRLLGWQGQQIVKKHYSPAVWCERLIQLYSNQLNTLQSRH